MSMETEAMSILLRDKVTVRFDQIVHDAVRRLEGLQREVDDLRAARGSMQWEVEGVGSLYLNIADGQMTVAETPLEAPFMTVAYARADWERFASGAVSSMFGGSSKQGLGQNRIQRLRAIKGTVRFVVTGLPDGEFGTLVHFGPNPRPAQAQTTIRVAADVAEKMQRGELNPQMAFMQGQIKMEGDAALAMQIGMAMAM